jgi:hypothetical protein
MEKPMKKFPARQSGRTGSRISAMAVIAVLLTTGCASVGAPQQSRSLSDFEQLSLQPDGSRAWRDDRAGRYDAAYLDPAAISFTMDLGADHRDQVTAALMSSLSARFASAGIKSAKPSAGVRTLAVRATVTAVELSSPVVNVLTTVLVLAPLSRGGLTVEIEAVDAATGQRVAALAFKGKAGVENITWAYSATGHARLQAEEVASRFVALVVGNPTSAASLR